MAINYGSDVGCKSGSRPSKLQACGIKKEGKTVVEGGQTLCGETWATTCLCGHRRMSRNKSLQNLAACHAQNKFTAVFLS